MTIGVTISLAGPTRGRVVELAFGALGIGDVEPEEIVNALKVLDAMMREWPWNGLGYEPSSYGEGLPTDPTGIADDALSGVYHELAKRVAPTLGKQFTPGFMAAHARSVAYVTSKVAAAGIPQAKRHPATFAGDGTRRGWRTGPYLTPDP